MTATAAPGIVTGGSPPNAVVQIQPGMNVQPVVLVDQTGNYITSSGGTAVALATTTTAVNVSGATAPTTGQALTATSGTAATWQGPYAPLAGATFTGYVAPAVTGLSYGTAISVNAALGNAFNLTLAGTAGALSAPTNPIDGQVIRVRVTQGTAGSEPLAYASAYDFGATGSPALSTTAGQVDILGFEYVASLSKWCYLGSALGN